MFNYFFELRNRLVYVITTILYLSILSFNYKEALLFSLVKPSLFTYETNLPYFIYTDLTEVFTTYVKLALILSIYVSIPFTIQHLWEFIKSGLYKTEYFYLMYALYTFSIIWAISTLTVHYFLLPQLWQFFSGFGINIFQGPLGLHFEARLNEYLDFLIPIYFYSCFGSQIFIFTIVYILNISEHSLILIRRLRRYIYLTSFIIAALVTPPDVLSQLLIAFTILFTYEILILLLLAKNEYVLNIWKKPEPFR